METWPTKRLSVANLDLDQKNPRLGVDRASMSPQEIIQYLFEHDKAIEVAESIVRRGYFPNEPLLAIKDGKHHTVIEGNRRLAALKALRQPDILEGNWQRRVERLARRIHDAESISRVPVTVAPSRQATDRQIAGRHIGTPVLAWRAENRASFILEKLEEGYSNDELRDDLNFSISDIQQARQTRAIADMARSLNLPDNVQEKLNNPKANVFTTIERVFDSSVGREYLMVRPDPDHGIVGLTTKKQFERGFKKLVTDVALGEESSRTLNTNEQIRSYFKGLNEDHRVQEKKGSFVPGDLIEGRAKSTVRASEKNTEQPKRSKTVSKTVLPKDFKVRHGSERIVDVHSELRRLKREDFPNAGAVLLRVFFELAVVDYLKRTGEMDKLVSELKSRNRSPDMPFGVPKLKQMVPRIVKIAKRELPDGEAKSVEKAVKHDRAAPFTVADLHSFVHQDNELPGERDIQQFWTRVAPLFRLMLERDSNEGGK